MTSLSAISSRQQLWFRRKAGFNYVCVCSCQLWRAPHSTLTASEALFLSPFKAYAFKAAHQSTFQVTDATLDLSRVKKKLKELKHQLLTASKTRLAAALSQALREKRA